MNLFTIVDIVNTKGLQDLIFHHDGELSFSTNSTSSQVCSEMSEVIVCYRQEPPALVMISDLIYELERRKTLLETQVKNLKELEGDILNAQKKS